MSNFFKNIHPLLRRSKREDEYDDTNFAVLNALNYELTQAEQETITSKIQSSLESATGEYLDTWGDWFGYYRKDGWDDEYYRKRIIRYLLLKRGTIPAIIDAIVDFLDDNEATVEIYEPWRNIFYTNKSKLNGADHMMGYYYRFAIIDISIDRPFPAEVIEVIKAFKPAGVLFYIRQDSSIGVGGATIYHPVGDMEVSNYLDAEIDNGASVVYRGNVNLTDSAADVEHNNIFYTNKSHLNSSHVLAGSFSHGRDRLHLGSVTSEYVPKENLLSNTNFASLAGWERSHAARLEIATDAPTFPGKLPVRNVFKITQAAGQSWAYLCQYTQTIKKPTVIGKHYTVSAWVYVPSTVADNKYQIGKFDSEPNVGWINNSQRPVVERDKWVYASHSFTATHVNTVVVAGIAGTGSANFGHHYIAGMKLEEGASTGFSLAPENDTKVDYTPKPTDTLAEVKLAIGENNEDLYIQTKDLDDRSAGVLVEARTETKAYAVLNIKDYVNTFYLAQLAALTKTMTETEAIDLMFGQFSILTALKAMTSPSDKLTGKMQVYDFVSKKWFDLNKLSLDLNKQVISVPMNSVSSYMNNNGLMFIRYAFDFKEAKDVNVELDLLNVLFTYDQGDGLSLGIQAQVVGWYEIPITTLTLNTNDLTLGKGKNAKLTATIYPTSATNKVIEWVSSDPTIATVDKDGKVSGIKAGITEITAYGDERAISTKCKVTVYDMTVEPAKVDLLVKLVDNITPTPTTINLEV